MSRQLTEEDARQSLGSHVADKGLELREKYGPEITWSQLMLILEDRSLVRYPCEIVFDAEHLLDNEFVRAMPRGDLPEEGFILYVHPFFSVQPHRVPALVLYHLVVVNYGAFASSDDAETFGSCALGMSKDEYYALLCEAADELVP